MGRDIGVQVEFARMRQGIPCNAFQFTYGYKIVPNQKYNVFKVGIKTAIQFAERNAVRIGNVDFQISKLADADTAFLAPLWQRDKPLYGNWFNVDFHFFGNLHNGLMQFVWVDVVADKVNINGRAQAPQQG